MDAGTVSPPVTDASGADADTATDPGAALLDGEVSRSGTRIRRVVHDAGGGAVVPLHMHDLERDVACGFRRFVDGSYRCVPLYDDAVSYSDAGCTQPIAFVYDACSTTRPRYFSRGVATPACGEDLQVQTYALSDRLAQNVSDHYYSRAPDGDCVAVANERSEGKLYEVEAVGAEHWAEASVMTFPRGEAAAVEVYVSQDGARELRRVVDRANGWSCLPDGHEPDGRCVPAEVAVAVDVFGDLACMEPAAAHYGCAPGAARGSQSDPCVPAPLFRLGAAYTSGRHSVLQGAQCVAMDNAFEQTVSRLGAAIARGELPAVEHQSQGTGALRALVPTIAGGAVGPAVHFTDAAGQRCAPWLFADGSYRCLPSTVRVARRYYADAACSDPELVFTGDASGACGGAAASHAAFEQSVDCVGAQLLSVHELGAAYTGAFVYGKWIGTDACVQASPGPAGAFRVGAPIALGGFGELSFGVER
jgi:hypothetical protein